MFHGEFHTHLGLLIVAKMADGWGPGICFLLRLCAAEERGECSLLSQTPSEADSPRVRPR